MIEINLTAAIRLTLALEERFADGAAVINLSSRASLGNFGQANYSASKAGLVGFGRALAQRWAPRVRVNAVAPSLVDTPMTQAMPPEVLAKLVARIPAGRIGTPDDVAGIVAFLASPEAAYITGQVIYACGGRTVAPDAAAKPPGRAAVPVDACRNAAYLYKVRRTVVELMASRRSDDSNQPHRARSTTQPLPRT